MSDKRMWPTPVVSDYKGGVSLETWGGYDMKTKAKRSSVLRHAVVFPTPGTTGLSNGSGNCEKANQLYEDGVITDEERKSFRAGNGGQLNPGWVEWLMGWPKGWVSLEPMEKSDYERWEEEAITGTLWTDDPADFSSADPDYIPRRIEVKTFRKEQLMALGNGQVPSCACLAETILREAIA